MKNFVFLKRLSNAERQNQFRMRSSSWPNLLKMGILICFTVVSVTGMALAQAGQLDTTFATKGIFVLNSIGQQGGTTSVALQSDDNLVFATASGNPQLSTSGIALVRLNANGTPDASFGTAGVVRFGVSNTVPVGLVIQPDGDIVVASSTGQDVDGQGAALSRFNSSGTLDNSFGTGGNVELVPLGFSSLAAVVLQPDGKFLVIGSGPTGTFLARVDGTGQLDATFAVRGLSVLPFSSAAGIALQSNGQILIASAPILNTGGGNGGTIARFNSNGTLDQTFGLFGQIATVSSGGLFDPSGVAPLSSIVPQADGKFIVAGTITSKLINPPGSIQTGFSLVRYNLNGSIDTSFGTRGGVLTSFGSNPSATAFALAIQSNGDIIAAGQAGSNLALSRYTSTGKLDTTFGSGGTVTTSLGSNASAISSLTLQSDGKIVAAGSIFSTGSLQFQAQAVVARYLAQ